MASTLFVFGIPNLLLIVGLVMRHNDLNEYIEWFGAYGALLVVIATLWIPELVYGNDSPAVNLLTVFVLGVLNLIIAAYLYYVATRLANEQQQCTNY